MPLIEINKTPSRKDLLWFGVIFALFFGAVGGLAYGKFAAYGLAYTIWIGTAAVTALYYLIPPARKPVYIGWLYAALPIGWVLTHVLLGITYYAVITPLGLLRRVLGGDPLERNLDRSVASYWIKRREARTHSDYFRQF